MTWLFDPKTTYVPKRLRWNRTNEVFNTLWALVSTLGTMVCDGILATKVDRKYRRGITKGKTKHNDILTQKSTPIEMIWFVLPYSRQLLRHFTPLPTTPSPSFGDVWNRWFQSSTRPGWRAWFWSSMKLYSSRGDFPWLVSSVDIVRIRLVDHQSSIDVHVVFRSHTS